MNINDNKSVGEITEDHVGSTFFEKKPRNQVTKMSLTELTKMHEQTIASLEQIYDLMIKAKHENT